MITINQCYLGHNGSKYKGEMSEINYYLIPGMGADHRIYQKFKLEHGNVHYLNWVDARDSRTMTDFAHIVAEKIQTQNNVIIGSSMGGMMSVELSRIVNPLATILISAPTGVHQFPKILKAVKQSKIHKAVTPKTIPYFYKLADTFMGFKSQQQRDMFYEMINGLGPKFIHFSVKAVLEWDNRDEPSGKYLQIVGSKDVLFDYRKMKNPIVLQNGGHFSAFDRGEEVSQIINDYVKREVLNF
jgi:pimeloyl-ACP methyl ester carboxylesterase